MKLLIFVALNSIYQVVFDLFCFVIGLVAELLQNFLVGGHSLTYQIFPQFASNRRELVDGSSSLTLRFNPLDIDFC